MVNWLSNLFCRCELNQISQLQARINALNQQMAALNQQIVSLQQAQNIAEPPSLGKITFQEAYNVLKVYTPVVFLSDDYFNTTSMEEAKKFCIDTKVWTKTWIVNDHDCDNFSFAMQGYWSEGLKSFAFGIAWSGDHAFNFFIDNNKQLWVVEPQNNNFYTVDQAKAISSPSYFPFRFVMC